MPNLHVHYYHGSLKAFRQELDGTANTAGKQEKNGASSSLGKSWTMSNGVGNNGKADPNERDAFGRTYVFLSSPLLKL